MAAAILCFHRRQDRPAEMTNTVKLPGSLAIAILLGYAAAYYASAEAVEVLVVSIGVQN
jgi:hypothetical protein